MKELFEQSNPFPKAQRRVIFYLGSLLFLLLAPLIVLYSLGYNFDLKTGHVVRTGGIFIKTNQNNFRVFINNNAVKEGGLLSFGALVTNLAPDLYSVRVEKDGFRPWQRVIHVTPESINEFRSVLLIPEIIEEDEVLNLIQRDLTIEQVEILPESSWVLLRAPERTAFTYFFNLESKVFDAIEQIENFRWDPESQRLLVKRKGPVRFSIVNLANGRIQESPLRPPTDVGMVTAADFGESADEFFILTNRDILFRFNRAKRTTEPLFSDVHSFHVSGGRILFVTKKGFLSSANFNGEEVENLGRKGFYLSDEPTRMEMNSYGDAFLIDSAGGFFVRRRGESEVIPISGNIVEAEFSQDGKKLLSWSENALEVLWVADEKQAPFRKSGTRERILSLGEERLTNAAWFGKNEAHSIFSAGKFIGVVDIDNRGGGPAATIIFGQGGGVFDYDAFGNGILRASGSFLYSSSF